MVSDLVFMLSDESGSYIWTQWFMNNYCMHKTRERHFISVSKHWTSYIVSALK